MKKDLSPQSNYSLNLHHRSTVNNDLIHVNIQTLATHLLEYTDPSISQKQYLLLSLIFQVFEDILTSVADYDDDDYIINKKTQLKYKILLIILFNQGS